MKRRMKVLVVVCLFGAAGAMCAVLFSGGPGPPPLDSNEATTQETVTYLASEDFAQMRQDDKKQYVEQVEQINDCNDQTPMLMLMMNSSLTEEQRQQLLANILPVISGEIGRRIDEFEALPPEKQVARLDAIIDLLEQYRKANPGMTFSPERANMVLQHIDPYTRARLRKHFPDVRKRMEQRGIPMSNWPF